MCVEGLSHAFLKVYIFSVPFDNQISKSVCDVGMWCGDLKPLVHIHRDMDIKDEFTPKIEPMESRVKRRSPPDISLRGSGLWQKEHLQDMSLRDPHPTHECRHTKKSCNVYRRWCWYRQKKYDYQIKMSFSLIIKIQTTWLWNYFNCWWLDVSYFALKDEYNP